MGFRPSCMKVFIPLTDGFFSRQEQRRNAVLANVVGPARLRHFPQDRDFILFLLVWVRAEDLVGRETLRLPSCKLWCFHWNPYGGAPRSRLSFKAWIQIVSLPFEC